MKDPQANMQQQDVFQAYKQAVERFHSACRTFREADVERNSAEKELHQLTETVTSIIKQSLDDPTNPQPPQVPFIEKLDAMGRADISAGVAGSWLQRR